MGRMSKRSIAIMKGWETRKANLQAKMLQGKNMNENSANVVQAPSTGTQDIDPSQVQLAFSAPEPAPAVQAAPAPTVMENGRTMRKVRKRQVSRGRARKPVETITAAPKKVGMDFDCVSEAAFTYEQIRELGAKAIFDGQNFRLLKHNGNLVFA